MASGENVCFTDDDNDVELEDIIANIPNSAKSKFDNIVGYLEDIIVEPKFQTLQNDFLSKYCDEFEDTDENKLSYTPIHEEYIQLIETYLNRELSARCSDFSMENFMIQIMEQKDQLCGEVFEMLLTFTDFQLFKEVMIDYRKSKAGMYSNLSLGITVCPYQCETPIHRDAMNSHSSQHGDN